MRIDRQEEDEARAEKVQHPARRYGRIRQEIEQLKAMDTAKGLPITTVGTVSHPTLATTNLAASMFR